MKKNIFISCSGAKHLGSLIAKKSKSNHYILDSEVFPDGELRIRLPNVKNKNIYFIQSFYNNSSNVNDKIIEILFAGKTAKELGAKNIYLIAPYLCYLRGDFMFKKGIAVSAKIISDLFSFFKKVYVVEPHLHRFKSFNEFFLNAEKISLANEFAVYIKKNIGDCLLIGPDEESRQWVEPISKILGLKYEILKKKRLSSRKVHTKGKKIKTKNAVIIDDIISTGDTLIKASKLISSKKLYFIGTHGLFSEGALNKLKKKAKVITSNSILSSVSKIDCSNAIFNIIEKNL
jgi:ribose-phosphate pyrophosphokinase